MRGFWVLVVVGCPAPLEPVDHCEVSGVCTPCEDDAACVIAANPCLSTAICGHLEDEISVAQLGCSNVMERPLPEAACVCDGVCGFED